MDQLPRSVRGKSAGKLTFVLRHGLRGIKGDESNIADSYRERGLPVPEHIATPPSIEPEHRLYWVAYADLQHDRPDPGLNGGMRRITWSAIANYARHHGMNVDELKRFIWALDTEFINSKTAPDPDAETEDAGK